MYQIKDGRLYWQDQDVSDDGTSEDLKQMAANFKKDYETLLLYAKFKASVEKAAVTCFGETKKRKPKAKAPAPNPNLDNAEPNTIPEPNGGPDNASPIVEVGDGRLVNTNTGEVF